MIDGPRLKPASGGKARSLVVFLHGYGADGNDLLDLGRAWSQLLPHSAFVSPHAPQPCAGSPMGKQWFALTMRDPHEYARGVTAARPVLDAFLDAEMARLGIDESGTALVGFSQGTMMALHVGPHRTRPLAGIVGFSGLLADPNALGGTFTKPPVLLIHGDLDQVIPVAAVFGAAQAFGRAEVPVEWHISTGVAHGIGPDGLEIAGRFLQRVMPH